MKKKVLLALTALLLVTVLCISLAGCLQIGLKKNSVEKRLTENGYTILHGRPPVNFDTDLMKSISLDNSFSAGKGEGEGENLKTYFIYCYYCSDTDSADRLEDLANTTEIDEEDGSKVPFLQSLTNLAGRNCILYRHENIIFIGDFESVAIARNY